MKAWKFYKIFWVKYIFFGLGIKNGLFYTTGYKNHVSYYIFRVGIEDSHYGDTDYEATALILTILGFEFSIGYKHK